MNDAGRIGFVIKGNYDNATTYDFLDVVYYNGSSYVAKKLTVGNTPQDNNEFWQVITKSQLTGVKGNAESEYRTGDVNITPDNIGLGNVDNTADTDKNVATAETLAAPRMITVGDASREFDGSADITFTLNEIGVENARMTYSEDTETITVTGMNGITYADETITISV